MIKQIAVVLVVTLVLHNTFVVFALRRSATQVQSLSETNVAQHIALEAYDKLFLGEIEIANGLFKIAGKLDPENDLFKKGLMQTEIHLNSTYVTNEYLADGNTNVLASVWKFLDWGETNAAMEVFGTFSDLSLREVPKQELDRLKTIFEKYRNNAVE